MQNPKSLTSKKENEVPGKHFAKLILFAAFGVAFGVAQASAQGQYGARPVPPPDQSTAQQAPEGQQIEQTMTEAFRQDPELANVDVRVKAREIVLTGTVTSKSASDAAEQVAAKHAAGRKITNHIQVNPSILPGPGFRSRI